MPMKTLGIFVAYSPNMSMKREGLGRYLAAFITSAVLKHGLDVVIAAPSWSRAAIAELLEEAAIPLEKVTYVGPTSPPLSLRVAQAWNSVRSFLADRRSRPRKPGKLRVHLSRHGRGALARLARTRNPATFLLLGAYLGLLGLLGALVLVPIFLAHGVQLLLRFRSPSRARRSGQKSAALSVLRRGISRATGRARQQVRETFADMHRHEISLIADEANKATQVAAWYIPTAFWAVSHKLTRPSLVCVPDVVLAEFPVEFARYGDASVQVLATIRRVLQDGHRFVTYSNRTKFRVLGETFFVPPQKVDVVPHAPIDLSHHVDVTGFKNNKAASVRYSRSLLASALSRSVHDIAVGTTEIKYIFYPTQFRPSKNVVTLLRAYNYLLRRRFIGHKLILTGSPANSRAVANFVEEENLRFDVLFLKDLTERELAATYKLADLAINPSLSEGGMPFTFTEALSVGTPVVMSDIEVTREVLTDPQVLAATVFDPYDWRALADKIEWALNQRDELYTMQRRFYDQQLAQRTWDDVVGEHIALLDQLANEQVPVR